jgi:transposase-like protein
MHGWLVALVCVPSLALACWNEVRLTTSQEAKGLETVERVLSEGDAKGAIQALRTLYGKQAIMHPERISSDANLGQKARAFLAIAIIRARTIDPKTGRGAKTSRQRQLQRLATHTLKRLRQKHDLPRPQAWHAEALALRPETAATAKTILEGLAREDLLSEPEAWQTLARLRHQNGESETSAAALKRCTAMFSAKRCTRPKTGGS